MVRLFVGGINDGTTHDVPDLPVIELPLTPRQSKSFRFQTEAYRKEKLYGDMGALTFYVSFDITTHEAVKRLLAYYKPPEA